MQQNSPNGAHTLIRSLTDAGVEVCLANPGTSEMHMVEAIDGTPALRPVLCLFEGVCTGAAAGHGAPPCAPRDDTRGAIRCDPFLITPCTRSGLSAVAGRRSDQPCRGTRHADRRRR